MLTGLKKHGEQAIGKSKGGWNTKLHVVSADDKVVVEMHLSGGERHDGPEGRISIKAIEGQFKGVPLLMDRAYGGMLPAKRQRRMVLSLSYRQSETAKTRGNMTKQRTKGAIL